MIEASRYIDLQFQDRGRGPRYDCYGLVLEVLRREYGITGLPDFSGSYRHTGDRDNIKACIASEAANWNKVSIPKEGDVIVFNIGGWPQHVGICVGERQGQPMFLHIHKGANSTVEPLNSSIWKNRISGIYRYE